MFVPSQVFNASGQPSLGRRLTDARFIDKMYLYMTLPMGNLIILCCISHASTWQPHACTAKILML